MRPLLEILKPFFFSSTWWGIRRWWLGSLSKGLQSIRLQSHCLCHWVQGLNADSSRKKAALGDRWQVVLLLGTKKRNTGCYGCVSSAFSSVVQSIPPACFHWLGIKLTWNPLRLLLTNMSLDESTNLSPTTTPAFVRSASLPYKQAWIKRNRKQTFVFFSLSFSSLLRRRF